MSKSKQNFTYEFIDPNDKKALEEHLRHIVVEKLLSLHISESRDK